MSSSHIYYWIRCRYSSLFYLSYYNYCYPNWN